MSSDESDSDGDDFVRDRNNLAMKLRDGTYFSLSVEVGPQNQPQGTYVPHQDVGWIFCDRPSVTCNAWTHRVREDITYKPGVVALGRTELNDAITNVDHPTNSKQPHPMRLELEGVVPALAWRFHWKRPWYLSAAWKGKKPSEWPHCPLCPAKGITGWRASMDHMRTVRMRSYPRAIYGYNDESTMVGDEVSDLHDDPEVFHHALRQAILVERDVFWHEFNRWKLRGIAKWTLQQRCKQLRVKLPEDILRRIVNEVEKCNRAAAVARHSAGVVVG